MDDEKEVRHITASVLTSYGYRVLTAADGAEAVSIYANKRAEIRVVLTDIMMPVVDGVALCRVLRKMNPDVMLIASTGYANESRMQELRSLNLCAVLRKPFSAERLLAALDESISAPQIRSPQPELLCA